MQKKRLILDISTIYVGLIIFSAIRVIFVRYLPYNNLRVTFSSYGLNLKYSIFLNIIIVIIFFFYGWSMRRWFIKNESQVVKNPLSYILFIFLPIFLLLLVFSIIISFLNLPDFHITKILSSASLEILQVIALSSILGILFFSGIEKEFSKFTHKSVLESKYEKFDLDLFFKQLKKNSKIYGVYLSSGIAVFVILINLLLIILYPSIDAISIGTSLDFFYPNFWYHFDASNGFAQELFAKATIPPRIIFDWKLAQAILSILTICLTASILLIKRKDINTGNKISTKINKNKKLSLSSQDFIAFQILNPDSEINEYVPSHLIKAKTSQKFSKVFESVEKSSFLPTMKLTLISFFVTIFLIGILQNIDSLGLVFLNEDSTTYIALTKTMWGGFAEEIMFRVFLFGLPLLVVHTLMVLLKKQKEEIESSEFKLSLKWKKFEPLKYYISGGWGKFNALSVIFLISSSLAFSYVQPPYGLYTGKIIYTFVIGLICGYAYGKFGLHTAIFINIITELMVNFILRSNNGIILNSPYLLMFSILFGTIFFAKITSLALTKVFKLGKNIFR